MSKRASLTALRLALAGEHARSEVACKHERQPVPSWTQADRDAYPPKQFVSVCPDCGSRTIHFSGLD